MKFDPSNAPARFLRLSGAMLLAAVFGLSACAQMGDRPEVHGLQDATSLGLANAKATALNLTPHWWRVFGDAQLDGLVEQALAANPSLDMARARVARAEAGATGVGAAAGPQWNGSLDVTHQQYTANGAVPAPLAGSVRDTGTLQLAASWELDFFGKNRSALSSALGQVRVAQAEASAARMLLASRVAHSYFQLARLNDQLRVAHQALSQREQALRLVKDRVSAGLDTRLELRQSEGGLPEARLQIEILQEQVSLAQLALAALVGEPNQPLKLLDTSLLAVRSVQLESTIPSDLLARRADIAAARWRVEAASQDVNNAQAQFYPSVNLVAFAGLSSIGLDRLVDSGSEQWGIGPAIRLPLFDGGRLRANLRGKEAELEGAIGSYNAAVIDAVREVAGVLATLQAIARQQLEQQATLTASEDAYGIAVQRYDAGLSNYLSVLATEGAVLQQRRQAVDLSARAIDAQVSLMHALGGGYRAEMPATLAHKN
ncbi:MAG: efflux transporter outer membrane subunit [Rhodoferax sp.]|nr:efflux transporter outer membrane subunit [Rhodoferax sp.]MBP7490477.1 efflux transporter outer membrane subunit [Rhodoferax sp.]